MQGRRTTIILIPLICLIYLIPGPIPSTNYGPVYAFQDKEVFHTRNCRNRTYAGCFEDSYSTIKLSSFCQFALGYIVNCYVTYIINNYLRLQGNRTLSREICSLRIETTLSMRPYHLFQYMPSRIKRSGDITYGS